eukprot:365617-Chlamydomonas_euryale.AAC.3
MHTHTTIAPSIHPSTPYEPPVYMHEDAWEAHSQARTHLPVPRRVHWLAKQYIVPQRRAGDPGAVRYVAEARATPHLHPAGCAPVGVASSRRSRLSSNCADACA